MLKVYFSCVYILWNFKEFAIFCVPRSVLVSNRKFWVKCSQYIQKFEKTNSMIFFSFNKKEDFHKIASNSTMFCHFMNLVKLNICLFSLILTLSPVWNSFLCVWAMHLIFSFQNRKDSDGPESVGKIVMVIQKHQNMKKQICNHMFRKEKRYFNVMVWVWYDFFCVNLRSE